MKHKLIFITIFSILFLFSACEQKPLYDVNYPKPVIVEPDEDTAYNINGYKDATITSQASSSIQSNSTNSNSAYQGKYIGNKNSKKIHKTECTYAKNMKEENIMIFESVSEAKICGYQACTKCLKE